MCNFAGFQLDEIVNGEELGMTVYFQGCSHHCKGCHNPETWEFGKGKYCLQDVLIKIRDYFLSTPFAKRLTLSGGDPLDNPHDVQGIVSRMRDVFPNIKIWLYTGYVIEELDEKRKDLCKQFDVVVDGPFIEELRDITLPFRGSSNQRIINKDDLNLLC